mmetsp:Transcript_55808/g.65219  ORF Transcript_55808/g.65219 Transcript_55808/m.65219 type:complete len:156 (+) Transcript_55808:285-752(+)
MKRWIDTQIPSYAESITDMSGYDKFSKKAIEFGLPQVILFASKAKSSPLTKYLSAEFRRRVLLAEVYPTKKNKELMDKYGVQSKLPAIVVIPAGGGDPIYYEGGEDGFTRRKLHSFFSKHALKEKVFKKNIVPPKEEEETPKNEEPPKTPVGAEL